jgi:acetyl-CoA carboxylase alpha subunit
MSASAPADGSAFTAQSANKARHFVDLCSAYHIPIIFLQDVPGVMPGPKAEQEGASSWPTLHLRMRQRLKSHLQVCA